ncbi:hypothetical protein NC653_020681 [Populus alba x Populus x berolinensis]|uniref:Plastocyanin-like domain-containing protein n=1 Tax=Populus alba x Populus x berolinensis TaxID=444605 RepID=A0AAD6QEJ8_9ROSI|nr:hypothetical protein NC653_020681 [Populus alba x Populus x berolinensis]
MVLQATAYIAYGSIQQLASYYKMLTLTANSSETHPWHLHRHDFWALGYGTGKYNMSNCASAAIGRRRSHVFRCDLLNENVNPGSEEATGEENSRVGADDDEETEDVSALNTNRED